MFIVVTIVGVFAAALAFTLAPAIYVRLAATAFERLIGAPEAPPTWGRASDVPTDRRIE